MKNSPSDGHSVDILSMEKLIGLYTTSSNRQISRPIVAFIALSAFVGHF